MTTANTLAERQPFLLGFTASWAQARKGGQLSGARFWWCSYWLLYARVPPLGRNLLGELDCNKSSILCATWRPPKAVARHSLFHVQSDGSQLWALLVCRMQPVPPLKQGDSGNMAHTGGVLGHRDNGLHPQTEGFPPPECNFLASPFPLKLRMGGILSCSRKGEAEKLCSVGGNSSVCRSAPMDPSYREKAAGLTHWKLSSAALFEQFPCSMKTRRLLSSPCGWQPAIEDLSKGALDGKPCPANFWGKLGYEPSPGNACLGKQNLVEALPAKQAHIYRLHTFPLPPLSKFSLCQGQAA